MSNKNLIYFKKLADNQNNHLGIELNRKKKDAARKNLMALMRTYKYEITRPEHARCPYDEDFKNCSKTEVFMDNGLKLTVNFETITQYGKAHEYLKINFDNF